MKRLPWLALLFVLLTSRAAPAAESSPPQQLSTVEIEDVMMERAEKIIIPRFEIKDLKPGEALEAVRRKIREVSPSEDLKFEEKYEPTKAGESQPLSPAIPGLELLSGTHPAAPPEITVDIADVPVSQLLRYVVGLSGGRLEVLRGAAFLAKLKTRTLPFVFNDPSLCEELEIDAMVATEIRQDVKQYLEKNGVEFHPGTACQVYAGGRSLFVKHTPEDLGRIGYALNSVIPVALPGPDVPKFQKLSEIPLRRRAEQLILKNVNLVDVSLEEAVKRLWELSGSWDVNEPSPGRRGIAVVLGSSDSMERFEPRRVRYQAEQVSLFDAVNAIAKQVEGVVSVERYAIAIRPKSPQPLLLTREYLVPRHTTLLKTPSEQELFKVGPEARNFLSASGPSFPPGPSQMFQDNYSLFIARNTEAVLQQLETFVERAWREYYASDKWPKEQKRQQRLRELGLYRGWRSVISSPE